jgi:hypothetical protein
MNPMPAIPESTRTSLAQRLRAHAREHWPQLAGVTVRYRAGFAYIDGQLPGGEVIPLCRLRYGGSARTWGFALYLASSDRYEDQVLHTGAYAGTPQEALDCAAGLYLSSPDF